MERLGKTTKFLMRIGGIVLDSNQVPNLLSVKLFHPAKREFDV
jgi:hypothetical protein